MDKAVVEGLRGRPSPNPHVGAVIAKDEDIIAVGHHERAGECGKTGIEGVSTVMHDFESSKPRKCLGNAALV